MPLSENEQRLLEQMERALYQEDPKFATSMRGSVRQASGRRLALAGAGLVGGLLLVIAGVANQAVLLGVLGFLVMMGATVLAMTGQRRSGPTGVVGGTAAGRGARPRTAAAPPRTAGFMQRLEERWDRRKGGQGL